MEKNLTKIFSVVLLSTAVASVPMAGGLIRKTSADQKAGTTVISRDLVATKGSTAANGTAAKFVQNTHKSTLTELFGRGKAAPALSGSEKAADDSSTAQPSTMFRANEQGAIVPPFSYDFGSGFGDWTIIDANGDNHGWELKNGSAGAYMNYKLAMDDWLISPSLQLEAGYAYEISFRTKCSALQFVERLEVKIGMGKTVEDMTQTLMQPTDIGSTAWTEYRVKFFPGQSGEYNIGFHGISDADKMYLFVNNVKVAAGLSAQAPAAVSDLTATPDINGALKCQVSFRTPTQSINDNSISTLTKVEVSRGGTVVKTFNAPAVGQLLSFEDELANNGQVEYTVVAYNSSGIGEESTVGTFVGFTVPADIESAYITQTDVDGQVRVSWPAVTKDANGKNLPEGAVTYILAKQEGRDWNEFVNGITGTSYTYQAVDPGKQGFVKVGVFAENSEGYSMGAETENIAVGTPYYGMRESFTNHELGYLWGYNSIMDGELSIFDDNSVEDIASADGDNGYVAIHSQTLDYGANFFSGLISLEGIDSPSLRFNVYNIDVEDDPTANTNELTVYVRETGATGWTTVSPTKTVASLCGNKAGWGVVNIPLDAYAGKTIQIQFTGVIKKYTLIPLDNIRVGAVIGNDLAAVSISAPENVKAGNDYNVEVTVSNWGENDASDYTVELYADGEIVDRKELASLESDKRNVAVFSRQMSPIAENPVEYYAKVVYAADQNTLNNTTTTTTVTPIASKYPTATELAYSINSEGVQLTWNAPVLTGYSPVEITESFEDGDAFSNKFGDWEFIDLDGKPVGGINGMDIPGITAGVTTGSFWIWDQSIVGQGKPSYEGHSGNKYLFSMFCYSGEQSDEWAISPLLPGTAQDIEFYAKSLNYLYPEKIEVYYSTTGKDPNDFVKIPNVGGDVPDSWKLYYTYLPEGTKYFAIRSCASNAFMLMIDDVTFTPEPIESQLEIVGYNIFRNGVKINDAPVADTNFTDTNVENNGSYTYVVTTVYGDNRGQSASSNEVSLIYTGTGVDSVEATTAIAISAERGRIIVANAAGIPVSISAANGTTVYSGAGSARTAIAVAPGVYIVKVGNVARKLIVK